MMEAIEAGVFTLDDVLSHPSTKIPTNYPLSHMEDLIHFKDNTFSEDSDKRKEILEGFYFCLFDFLFHELGVTSSSPRDLLTLDELRRIRSTLSYERMECTKGTSHFQDLPYLASSR